MTRTALLILLQAAAAIIAAAACAYMVTIEPFTAQILLGTLVLFRWILPRFRPGPAPATRLLLDIVIGLTVYLFVLSRLGALTPNLGSLAALLGLLSLMFGTVAASETNRRALLRRSRRA